MPPVRRRRVDWDEIARIGLPDLDGASVSSLLPHASYDGLIVADLAAAAVDADDTTFLDCRLAGGTPEHLSLRRARFSSCEVGDLRVATLRLGNATLANVLVEGVRVGALDAPAAHLSRCTIRSSRLDFVNLRGAGLATVQFLDCTIGELDLGGAELRTVRFRDCRIGTLRVSAALLDDVDLTGADFSAVEGVADLAGALIDPAQLQLLAPALAAHLGIRVSDS